VDHIFDRFFRVAGTSSEGTPRVKLKQIVVLLVMILAGFFFVLFLLDLTIKVPFERFNLWTDVFVILSAGLILWQGLETWFEFKTKRK
jgi:hypothetical protein